jgi:hypothetical protein
MRKSPRPYPRPVAQNAIMRKSTQQLSLSEPDPPDSANHGSI